MIFDLTKGFPTIVDLRPSKGEACQSAIAFGVRPEASMTPSSKVETSTDPRKPEKAAA